MKIFADLHHAGLYYSFYLALEKRLGHELYRPIGTEWFEEGFWDIAKPYGNNTGTVSQFLSLGSQPTDGTPPLNKVTRESLEQYGMYTIPDMYHGYEQRAITLEAFKDLKFDIIIASIPDHWLTYEVLRRQYQPQAKLICHMGNIGWEQLAVLKSEDIKNLMASVKPFATPRTMNTLFYYQEQPVEEYMSPPIVQQSITSFVHLLPLKEQYDAYKEKLEDSFTFRSYGISCPDGWSPTLQVLYNQTRDSNFIYHVKPGGDGYGWNWHTAFMMGRGILTNFSDYRDKLGGILFEDMVTGIDLEKRTIQENCELLKKGIPEMSRKFGEAARKNWEKNINYENEGNKIKDFLNNLL